jgi:hypothetical protein
MQLSPGLLHALLKLRAGAPKLLFRFRFCQARFFDCFQVLEVYRDTMPVLNRTPAIVIGNMDIRVATLLCSSSMRWEVMLHVPTLRHLLEERKLALLQPLGVWHNALGHGAEQRYL